MTERRTAIAEAGVRLLASRGVRALTHRAVDAEAGLPAGSTSYYARTRRDLIGLIIQHLAERTEVDLGAHHFDGELTVDSVADALRAGLDATLRRADDHKARLILLLECDGDPDLRDSLSTRPQVRQGFVTTATQILAQLGVEDADARALDLIGLLDALLMQRIVRGASFDDGAVLRAYLRGLTS
ncbi:MAG: TetR family transcriptional regulator [Propioniciclava sp.]|uniref:TetR/AcrR family transcriptional regulator n=1 Tax=Propioniciclava sp. TaxID=2038686 RepID=UPI0039E43E72